MLCSPAFVIPGAAKNPAGMAVFVDASIYSRARSDVPFRREKHGPAGCIYIYK